MYRNLLPVIKGYYLISQSQQHSATIEINIKWNPFEYRLQEGISILTRKKHEKTTKQYEKSSPDIWQLVIVYNLMGQRLGNGFSPCIDHKFAVLGILH